MPDRPSRNPELSSWQVQMLRVTAFIGSGTQVDGDRWWSDLIGEPENKASRQRGQERQWDGPFGGGRLILQTQPGRVDWLYAREPDEATGEAPEADLAPSPLDSLTSSLETFLPLANCWLGTVDPISRLAFGAVLHLPVQSREEGYRQLSEFLPFDIDGASASDFLYQINRPRRSTTLASHLKINRLSKWSCYLVQKQMVNFNLQGPMLAGAVLSSATACRLELDINTAPDYDGELPRDRLCPLLRELVSLGQEIASKGDVP